MSTHARKTATLDVEPAFDAFAKRYEKGSPQVVWTRLVSDLETPVSVYLKVAHGKPMSLLCVATALRPWISLRTAR